MSCGAPPFVRCVGAPTPDGDASPTRRLTRSFSSAAPSLFYSLSPRTPSSGASLTSIAFDIFKSEGLVDGFNIPDERFKALLNRVELLYLVENPYHCALHAAVRRNNRCGAPVYSLVEAVGNAAPPCPHSESPTACVASDDPLIDPTRVGRRLCSVNLRAGCPRRHALSAKGSPGRVG